MMRLYAEDGYVFQAELLPPLWRYPEASVAESGPESPADRLVSHI